MFELGPRVVVFLSAMLPFTELRGSIPLALTKYGLNPFEAYLLSVAGNLLPVVFLLHFLGPIEQRLRIFKPLDRFFEYLFARTRRKHSDRIDKYGALGLVTFVAIPLPVTGAWTGVAAAYVFNLKKRYSFPAITLGVLIAGVLVTIITYGAVGVMK